MSECSICVEKYNKKTNRQIVCIHCNGYYCKKCMETYLLNESSDPKCMMCQHEFSHDFILANMTTSFMNQKYKTHRETILMDREKCLMPHTQEYVQYELKMRDLRKEVKQEEEEIKRMKNRINDLNRSIIQQNARLSRWSNTYQIENGEESNFEPNKSSQFIHCCPVDNCKGFLSTQWKCGICNVKVCNQCNSMKNENHECNEDDIKTMELLKKDTKPCPSCGSMIHKIQGCDQMWCVQCKTPFSWRTGKVEKGIVHNPHYYEWQRQENNGVAPRVQGDIQNGCVDIRYYDVANMRQHLRTIYNIPTCSDILSVIMKYHQLITHTKYYEIRLYRMDRIENANLDLRIKYMLNDLDDEKWKTLL